MPIPNVRINGTPFDIPQSRFIPHPPQPRTKKGLNGAHTSTKTEYGWTFDFIFGSGQLAAPGTLAAITDLLGNEAVVELTYTDEADEEHSHNVYLPEEVEQGIRWGNLAERVQITLYDTDQEPDGS